MSLVLTLNVPRAGGFDPASLFDPYPSVYGDYFRADLSTVQDSSGVFVRWPGLRDADVADAGACFDIAPWIGTNNVVAAGPHGEKILRPQYISGTDGRGGSQQLAVPSPFSSGHEADGMTIGILMKNDSSVITRLKEKGPFEATLMLTQANINPNRYTIRYYDADYNTRDTMVEPAGVAVGSWCAWVLRRDTATLGQWTIFDSSDLSAAITQTTAFGTNDTTSSWYFTGDNSVQNMAGFFRQHRSMSDAECLAMLGWLIAGAE